MHRSSAPSGPLPKKDYDFFLTAIAGFMVIFVHFFIFERNGSWMDRKTTLKARFWVYGPVEALLNAISAKKLCICQIAGLESEAFTKIARWQAMSVSGRIDVFSRIQAGIAWEKGGICQIAS